MNARILKLELQIKKLNAQLCYMKSPVNLRELAYELTVLEGQLETLIEQSRSKADAFIFSKPVVSRVLNIETQYIESVFADGEDAIAIISGKEHLVTRRRVIMAIAAMRKERGKGLKVSQDKRNPSSIFTVAGSGGKYTLFLHPCYIRCNCPDHQRLVKSLGTEQVACKHVYGLLNHLGYKSLNEYVKAQADFKSLSEASEKEAFESLGFPRYNLRFSDGRMST